MIQIDIDPAEIGRNYPVSIGAVADLKEALVQILEEAKNMPGRNKRPELREMIKETVNYSKNPTEPFLKIIVSQ